MEAFFEHSHDSVFGVVFRPDFEARLRAHLQNANQDDEDVAWYALRNAVYAIGCRTVMAMDRTRDFSEIQQESLRLFHNSFFVLLDLLYMPSGLMAVQALIVMVSKLLGCLIARSLMKYPDFVRRAFRKPGCRIYALCFCSSTRTIQGSSPAAIKGMESSKDGGTAQELDILGRVLLRKIHRVAIWPSISKFQVSTFLLGVLVWLCLFSAFANTSF